MNTHSIFRNRLALILTIVFGSVQPLLAAAEPDRIPGTWWLQREGMQAWEWDIDHDRDGFTTREEYRVGTDPRDASSRPGDLRLAIERTESELHLLIDSVPGVTYHIEGSEDLSVFAGYGPPIVGADGLTGVALPIVGNEGYFRVSISDPTDADSDGLSTLEEVLLNTDPFNPDTDGDGVSDGEEVIRYESDPTAPAGAGAVIRGTVYTDPNHDGDLTDGVPAANARVFLDTNYDGQLDPGERTETTDAAGRFSFTQVEAGLYHVRQFVVPPTVQTFPREGVPPTFDMLPDEVVEYVHAPPGVGDFDEPYGENASTWAGNWHLVEVYTQGVELVPPSVVLKPIGVRNVVPPVLSFFGSEFLSLPLGASIMVRFHEAIVDGPGPDLIIYSITSQGNATEEIEVLVGPTPARLRSIGNHSERMATIPIDLAEFDLPNEPIYYIKCVSRDNGGGWKGFDLTGFEAINIAPPNPAAHVVQVLGEEVFADRDFGSHFIDLPPRIVIQASDNEPATQGLRLGESATLSVNAFDDHGIASVALTVDGVTAPLDANHTAPFSPNRSGLVRLAAKATDSGGQVGQAESLLYVSQADGTLPFDPNQVGPGTGATGAPQVRVVSPPAGHTGETNVLVIADITGSPAPAEWVVQYAPVDAVHPYETAAEDADYVTLASGRGPVLSSPIATLPLESLPDGIYFLRVCASNGAGLRACEGQVFAKNLPTESLRPTIEITAPTSGTNVTLTTDIRGTIKSARPLTRWYVEYAPADLIDLNDLGADHPAWRRFAEGTNTLDVAGHLATFDATTVKNNGYVVRVVAWNDLGMGWVEPLTLNVNGEAKLGRNRLEFTDASINLAGFPLTFTRVYDSLQADEDGELGYGWSFHLQDADIRETVPDTGPGGLFGSRPFKDGTRVYITGPTGERLGFTFKPVAVAGSLFGVVHKATFNPDPGNYHRLEIPEGELPFLSVMADGSVTLYFFRVPWNPDKYVLITPDHKRYTYDEDEGFLRAADLSGNTLTMNIGGISHSSGVALTFTRDAAGRITSVTDPDGQVWTYGYDAAGNLATVTNPDKFTSTYAYLEEPAHYLKSITDPFGRMPVRYEYDPDTGRLVATIDEHGHRAEVSWDPKGLSGEIVDRRGFRTRLRYDARGNATQSTDPKGNVTRYQYGDPLNPDKETLVTDALGAKWSYKYNARGQITEFLPPFINPNSRAKITYDTLGNPVEVRQPQYDAITADRFVWDEPGNLVESRPARAPGFKAEYSANGQQTRRLEGGGYAVNYTYDAHGHRSGVNDTLGLSETFENDHSGSVTKRTDSNGSVWRQDRTKPRKVEFTRPDGGKITEIRNPDGTATLTGPDGDAVTLALDSQGRITRSTLPNGGVIDFTYNENGDFQSLRDPGGNVTTFDYDSAGLVSAMTDAAGKSRAVAYDGVGNVIEITDRNGRRRSFEYNADRKLSRERWHAADGAVVREYAFAYDGGSNLRSVTDTAGAKTHRHEMPREDRPDYVEVTHAGQPTFRVAYDWRDGQEQLPAPRAIFLRRPNIVGDLVTIQARYHGGRIQALQFLHPETRNSGGEVRLFRRADGAVERLERISRTTASATDQFPFNSRFTYCAGCGGGVLSSIRHERPDGTLIHPDSEIAYVRDTSSRIIGINTPTQTSTYTYDAVGQLTGADHSDPARPDESYTYDLNGNRTSSHLTPGPATIAPGNRLMAIGSLTFAYDDEGNQVRKTDTATGEETRLTYDHRNRLVLATVHPAPDAPATNTVAFDYDYLNRLIMIETNGEKVWFLYDRDMPLAEFADGATSPHTAYFYSPDAIDAYHMVWRQGIGEQWVACNNLGTILGGTKPTGQLAFWTPKDAFGTLQPNVAQSTAPRIGFTGQFQIPEISLGHFRNRIYDPLVSKFLQEDPIGFNSGGSNTYGYAANNPLSRRDPTGTTAVIEFPVLMIKNVAIGAGWGAAEGAVGGFLLGLKCAVDNGKDGDYVWLTIAEYAKKGAHAGAAIGAYLAGASAPIVLLTTANLADSFIEFVVGVVIIGDPLEVCPDFSN